MYIYRFSIIILLAILSLTTASSQDIHALISKSMQAQGKEKYEVYRQLYLLFLDSDRQTAAKYAGKMLDTSYELGDPSLQAETHLICAHLYVQLLQHERGLHHCDKALAYYQINGPDTAVGNVYLLYGTIFNTQNYLTKAAESFLRSEEQTSELQSRITI